jgi:hypothetical protein
MSRRTGPVPARKRRDRPLPQRRLRGQRRRRRPRPAKRSSASDMAARQVTRSASLRRRASGSATSVWSN